MREMALFMSSARDAEGNPLVKAVLTGNWNPDDVKSVVDWLASSESHTLVIADGGPINVQWL